MSYEFVSCDSSFFVMSVKSQAQDVSQLQCGVFSHLRNRPLVEHGTAAVPRLGGHLPDIRLPGGERGADDDALEEGGRREGAPAADGVHADSVQARQQVPLRREGHRRAQEGRRLLRAADHRPLLRSGENNREPKEGGREGKPGKQHFFVTFLIAEKLLRAAER